MNNLHISFCSRNFTFGVDNYLLLALDQQQEPLIGENKGIINLSYILLSFSTVVLNGRDRQGNVWLL